MSFSPWVAVSALVAAVSFVWTNDKSPITGESFFDGSLLSSVTSDTPPLSGAHWPFSLMLTAHVINSVSTNGGFWASDIITCLFTAYGGLMMKDLLAGNFGMPFLFANKEAYLSLVIVSWYLKNHKVPFTKMNVWDKIEGFLSKYVPLSAFMELCSLAFNCSLLIATAMGAGAAGTNAFHLPALGATLFMCVALHCAGDFFNVHGVNFDFSSCSESAERAAGVAVWCGTNALAGFPIVGGLLGPWTHWAEAYFGGRANFLMSLILIDAIAGHLLPFEKPHVTFQNFLYKVTGVSSKAKKGKAKQDDAAGKGPFDLSDPNINLGVTLATVAGLSILDGGFSVPTVTSVLHGGLFTSVTDFSGSVNANWPFSLALTLHVFNSVGHSGGYWASDIISCCFTAYGGLMMKDVLAGNLGMPCLFADSEALLTLAAACWYLRNHNLPFTGINVWDKFYGTVATYIPLGRIMDLCTLAYNCSLLIGTAQAADAAGNTFFFLPATGGITFLCVAYHCAGDFLSRDGISFNFESCSGACERACVVAFWCATQGLGTFPFIGATLSGVTGQVEAVFGGRANFLMTMILVDSLLDHLIADFRPLPHVFKALYTVFGVSNGEDDDEEEGEEEEEEEEAAGPIDLSDPNVMMGMTLALVGGLSYLWSNGMAAPNQASLLDGSLWNSVTSNDKPLHATFWPHSLMFTMHVLNSVSSNGGHWASDIISCCFTAYGGLMMKDLLAGNFGMPCLFANNEASLSLLVLCWYLVNHKIGGQINVWKTVSGAANKFVPLSAFMDLCSLAFNCSLLIATADAAGASGNNFFHIPAVGGTIFLCVAYHCAGDFFNADGVSFDLHGCSDACERATAVAFWCATNGWASIPVVGGILGAFTAPVEAHFGGRANFLMSCILLEAVCGHLWEGERPHQILAKAIYKFTGVKSK